MKLIQKLGGVAFTENGSSHAQGHGYWDIYLTDTYMAGGNSVIENGKWTKITYVVDSDSNVTAYIDGVKYATASITDGGSTLDYITTCDKLAVGVGFCPALWLAGYVDEGRYISNIKVYNNALSAEQVATIE